MQLNDIFIDDNNYSKYVDFASQNGYFINEIEPLNGVRRFQICKPLEKTLDELKADKLNELATITSKFDNQLVNTDMIIKSSLGFTINADLRSQNNLRGLIAVGVEPVNFMDATNSAQSLTLEQLNVLLNETIKNEENLYKQKWAYAEKIKACKTIAELEKIDLTFEMLDFSKK